MESKGEGDKMAPAPPIQLPEPAFPRPYQEPSKTLVFATSTKRNGGI
jgi:hypothetical protein